VFYASILYTKTKSAKDAYLFASALSANQEKRRAAFILEKAGLLSFETLTYDEQLYRDEKEYVRLIVEAMLLAAHCLESFGEWDEVVAILECVENYDFEISLEEMRDSKFLNIVQRAHIHGETDSEYDREVGLLRLAHFLNSTVEQGDIHPIARLCLLRGKTFDEASNPSRAAMFLKLALEIDVKCIDAWTYLCQRRLLTGEEEIKFVTGLRFDEPDMDWLKDMFYAKLSISGTFLTQVSNKVGTATKAVGLSTLASPIAASTPMNIVLPGHTTPFMNMTLDSSSIHDQGTPFQFISGGVPVGGVLETPQSTAKSQENNLVKKQVESSFQNLHFKHHLSQSADVLGLAATRAYNNYNLSLALHYCQVLYEMDPLSMDTANIQIATLTALGQKRPLFRLAHTLVDADSKSAIAWYAVGCYYYACGRYALAQQHFWRSTRLDRRNALAWVAFGCAFAACDENDQANACFRTAQRLNSGSHYPMLYMGMEHLRTNNIQLAGHFLKSARNMEKNDPLCCNELGVWAYRSKSYSDAIQWFVLALRLHAEAQISEKTRLSWNEEDSKEDTKSNKPRFEFGQQLGRDTCDSFTERDCVDFCQDSFWECTIFNLGQSYRKVKRYDDAMNCFSKSLALCPERAMSFSALGFVRQLTGDIDGAIESYHQALSRKPDDPFATEMLNRAMQEALDLGPLSITSDSINAVGMSMTGRDMANKASKRNVMSQESIDESAFSLDDSDLDMSMT
jgi:Tetratricopeptide repeat.